jgi:hypothetical protein
MRTLAFTPERSSKRVNAHRYFGAILAVLIAVIGLAAFASNTLVTADPGDQTKSATTSVTVSGGPTTPIIECKWELPDMDLATVGIQYTKPPAPPHLHDDDMATGPTPANPCDLHLNTAGAPDGPATMANGAQHMIQVAAPNHIQGQPIPFRDIELWVAVEPVTAITDVFWDVYEPCPGVSATCVNGYFKKVQVHWDSPPTPQNDNGAVTGGLAEGLGRVVGNACDDYGAGTGPDGSMFEAAVHTGQLTARSVDESTNNWGMVSRCLQNLKGFYHAKFQLDKDEACGEYKIVAVAVANGTATSLTNYLDVLCNFYLETDFNAVNWGSINPGTSYWPLAGNLQWENPPGGAVPPTIANGNNAGMGVRVSFGVLTGAQWGKVINKFDACFGRTPAAANANCFGNAPNPPIPPNTPTDLTHGDAAYVLCANEYGKLDLSLHPDADLIADSYSGTLTVIGYYVPGVCYGDIHP